MLKRLARCVREYKWAAILSPLTMVGEVAMEVWIPLVMAELYDYGIVMQNMQVVILKSIQLVILALVSLAFGVMGAYYATKAGTGFAKICATICSTGCRSSAFPILTNSPARPS